MYENLTNLSLVKGAFAFLRKSWIYVIGAAALLWFMIRVIPKPGRAAYPCQRAAFPLASAFVLWMSGTLFSFKFVKDARSLLRTRRLAGAFALLVSGLLLFSLSNLAFPARELVAGVREARADVPVMIRSYTAGYESHILPAATVGLLKSQRENVLEIGYAEIEEMVREAVKLAGGFEEMISDGNTVVLKPNIVVNNFMGNPISPEANGMVTDWRVLAAVAKMVREQNPGGRILVIEGSASPSTQEGYELLKYTREFMPEVDEFIGIEDQSGAWKDTNSEYLRSVLLPPGRALYPDFKLPNGSAPYYYNKQYFEADVFISLPVLKNHESAGVTGAIKNMGIGGTPTNIYGNGEDVNGRWEVINHSPSELHKFIHDFYYGRPADFAVMDGIQGYSNGPNWNNGPANIQGHQEGMGLILASSDPLAMDAIASLVMFHDPRQVPHLVYLHNDGLGCADPMAIKVEGSLVSDVKKPFAHENHATRCSYTDADPPAAFIEDLLLEGQLLKIALAGTDGLARVDLQVDGQFLEQFITGDFGNIEVDLSLFDLSDSLLTLFIHDQYMNTSVLSEKIEAPRNLGESDIQAVMAPSLYPNPAVSGVKVRMNINKPGQVACLLYDLSGQCVKEQNGLLPSGPSEIDFALTEVSPGRYILVLVTGDERYSLPLIKL